MRRTTEAHEEDFGFQIAPMVDVIFVLMLFFMASAGLQTLEKGFTTSLPGKGNGSTVQHVMLDIAPDGQVSVNGTPFDAPADHGLPELRVWLKASMVELGNTDVLVVRPSPEVRHERITDVLSAAADAGVSQLRFN